MRRAVDEDVEVLLPATYGEESARNRERGAPRGQRLDRDTLVASIREQSESAGDAVEGILDWADHESRLNVRYTNTRCRIETGAGPLLRLARTGWPEKIRRLRVCRGPPDSDGVDGWPRALGRRGAS